MPMTVTLPPNFGGGQFTVNKLLADGDSNVKLNKSDKADAGYLTFGLSLSPANESGYQMCASSSEGCREGCLFFQGRARMFEAVNQSRVAKTVAFMEQRFVFLEQLRHEAANKSSFAHSKGKAAAFRLNVLSDVFWENTAPCLFSENPGDQFYDYTKHFKRMLKWCDGKLPANYHLTFSRSECNDDQCLDVLRAGGNVAVVFRKALPTHWNRFRVIDGDQTDLRFLEPQGVVVGLKAKGTARADESGFVVDTRRRVSLTVL